MVVFFFRYDENTYSKGRVILQMNRVVPRTKRGNSSYCDLSFDWIPSRSFEDFPGSDERTDGTMWSTNIRCNSTYERYTEIMIIFTKKVYIKLS